MHTEYYEELTPVKYDETSVKFIRFFPQPFTNCFRLHWHKRIEIIKIKEGTMKIRIGDTVESVEKNDVAIFFPGTPHEGYTEDEEAIYDVIMFEPSILKNNTLAYKQFIEPLERNNIIFHEIIRGGKISDIIDEMIALNESDNHRKKKVSTLYLTGSIFTLLGIFFETYDESKLRKSNRYESSFGKVIEYINQNYTKNISTQSISEYFGYNESYFSRRFRELTEISSSNYIKILRLEHAKKLLTETDFSINEIASESGFNDLNYFNRCFKQHFGIAPTKLKNNKKTK